MIKHLTTIGNAWNLYLTQTMLKFLDIVPGTSKILFTIENKSLYIKKVTEDEISDLENPLVKKVSKTGNSYSIFLTKAMLELIDINPEIDMVDIQINKRTLIIKKAEIKA